MPFARKTDPQTSHEAAESVKNISGTQLTILNILRTPMSDEQMIRYYRLNVRLPIVSDSGLRSRRAELVRLGLVEDTGDRVRMVSGRNAIVWVTA